jgi:hypothetical protein
MEVNKSVRNSLKQQAFVRTAFTNQKRIKAAQKKELIAKLLSLIIIMYVCKSTQIGDHYEK